MTKIFRMKNGKSYSFDWGTVVYKESTETHGKFVTSDGKTWIFKFDDIDSIEVKFN